MKSSYLTNLILLAIVLALLWLSQREESDTQPAAQLSTLTVDAVNQIQIERPGKPAITLQKQQQSWALTAPFSAQANQTRVNLLLSLLSAPLHGQFQPMDESALTQFGLSQPEVLLSMNEQQFAFGGTEPIGENRYVLHQGMVYLIQDDVTPLLTASAGSFVDNRLIAEQQQLAQLQLPVKPDSAERITLSQSDGQWRSENTDLSSDKLKALVDSWQHAYAMQVRDIPAEELSSLPEAQVQLWFQNDPTPVDFIIQTNAQTLQLISPALQLQYDFPLAVQSQLLPLSAKP
jgi:hypothetical protein